MPVYSAPVDDTLFILNEVLAIEQYSGLPGFEDTSEDVVEAVLREGAKFVEEVLQPLNASGDEHGCIRNDDASVTAPPGFKDAYLQFCEGGWLGLAQDPEFGGQGLPHVLSTAFEEYSAAANMAFTMYPGLTQGAIAAIQAVGSQQQQAELIPNMVKGRWTGTMNLTEPHCGTDLGLLRTKAEPQTDGSYKITGTKIFISAGEHDLSENIVHLVLAKMTDSPDTIRGISLFIVPKILINEDGSLGERNAVSCGAIEEKMGIHGNSTCVMNYDGATGYLIGEKEKGMRAMFIMMNAARLGVGMQGLAISEVAYQNAAAYARDRLQGRSLSGPKNADGAADPIIVHPDVRRMLLNAKAFNEGARALAMWVALLVDLSHSAPDEDARTNADDLVGLLTPVVKAFFTDKGYENATNAQQCLGGHGYIREWGMEQFVRDARIAMIYEGTNGIQALDLVGRKLARNGGRALRSFSKTVADFVAEHSEDETLKPYTDALAQAANDLESATRWLMGNALTNADNAGAASVPYLNLMAYVALGYVWSQMAVSATKALAKGTENESFYQNKLATADYFFSHMIAETALQRTRIEAGSKNLMALDAAAF
ncbi:MAG: acyl-CoA dehydrogenase C-terminal domain-containing protein [Pseudomonadota bacterium]